ncbi:MAG: hypothetical protein A2Z49_06100 [Chloroflexi bacterium RBG_19FT_COMBO_56_12]|nr:MAG: hypothetical protein A2Z49_06100 [Chloroflexi bacterium RBG_19FT_COMBO_56_12]
MAKNRVSLDRPLAAVALRSPVKQDPWVALAMGLACQGLQDLYSQDCLKALDALLWWIDESGGVLILRSVGLEVDPDQVFGSILMRGKLENVKQIHTTNNRSSARDGVAE